MKQYNSTKPIAFIHIPKAAGSSVNNILETWFGNKMNRSYFNENNNHLPPLVNLKNEDNQFIADMCIVGHFNRDRNMGIEQLYPEIEQYFTFLRDPFEVHLSNYFYVQKLHKSNNAVREGKTHPIIEQNMDLEQYLKTYNSSYYLNFLPPKINKNNFKDILNAQFVYIGISEDLTNSLNKLAKKLHKPMIKIAPEENISLREEQVVNLDDYKKTFIKKNPLVYDIYNYVKTLNSID